VCSPFLNMVFTTATLHTVRSEWCETEQMRQVDGKNAYRLRQLAEVSVVNTNGEFVEARVSGSLFLEFVFFKTSRSWTKGVLSPFSDRTDSYGR